MLIRTVSVAVLLIGAIGIDAQSQQGDINNTLLSAVANLTNLLSHDNQKGELCPFPFTTIMNQCFYINTYVRLDFNEAREFCQGMGGDLAQPKYPNALRVSIWDWEATKSIYDQSNFLKVGARIPDDAFWKIQHSVYFSDLDFLPENIRDANMTPRNNLTWVNGDTVEVKQVESVEGQQGTEDCLCLTQNNEKILPYILDKCVNKTPFICEYVK